jgi:putative BNR repeat neuraminidase
VGFGKGKKKILKKPSKIGTISGTQVNGYQGIWYYNQPSKDEYVFKYSGGLGTYCAKHIPFAIYAPEVQKTFFCYGGRLKKKNILVHMVSYYDHNTGLVPRPTAVINKLTDDAHDNPVIQLDNNGYIWIFSSSHGINRPSYIWRSKKPYDVVEFELCCITNFSYPQPWVWDTNTILFLHTQYMQKGRSMMYAEIKLNSPLDIKIPKIHNESPNLLARIEMGHYQVSSKFQNPGKNNIHSTKIGTAFNFHPDGKGLNYRTNLYYMETKDKGRSWHNITKDVIDTPLNSISNPALVYDFQNENRLVYMKDMTYDKNGNPVILFTLSASYKSGPQNPSRVWCIARWDGNSWVLTPSIDQIRSGDFQGCITSDSNYDTGCIFLDDDQIWRIYGPTGVGPQPYNPGGEIELWQSTNQGTTWEKIRQITKNSSSNHTYARRVLNAHPDFYTFWADGNPRKESISRLYFCNKDGTKVSRLPLQMEQDYEEPEQIQ